MWFILADTLKMTVAECQLKCPSSEFVKWQQYLKWKINDGFHREDHFLAQIACEIRRLFSKKPHKHKISDFMIKFKQKDAKKKEKQSSIPVYNQVEATKLMWASLVGYKGPL